MIHVYKSNCVSLSCLYGKTVSLNIKNTSKLITLISMTQLHPGSVWCKPFLSFISASVTYFQLHVFTTNFTSSLFFSDQTQYFIGRDLQSMSYSVEMMKWLWSTMKVTFGRWTVFIFITAEFLYYFPLIKHETHPHSRFQSVTRFLAPLLIQEWG